MKTTKFLGQHFGITIVISCFIILNIFMLHTLTNASAESEGLPEPQGVIPGKMGVISESEFIDIAKTDLLDLLEYMTINYDSSVLDYTGTFIKQERIKGKLHKEQTIDFKFRNKPFSLFMQWTKNPGKADRLLFVKGQNNNKMIVHPAGLFSLIKSVERDPKGKEVFKHSLRSCDKFGIRNLLDRISSVSKISSKNGNFKAAYTGETLIDKRPCMVIETDIGKIKVTDQKGKTEVSNVEKVILTVDLGYCLPVSIKSLDAKGNLISKYTYSNLKFNTNLSDANFTKKANKL